MTEEIDVLVIAAVRIYREATVQGLRAAPALRLVGSVGTAAEAVSAAHRLRPTVALFDLTVRESMAAVRAIRRCAPATRLIALGDHEAPDVIVAAAEAGVAGFVGRDCSIPAVAAAISGIVRGEASCPPQIAALLLRRLQNVDQQRRRATGSEPWESLTAREQQILLLMAEGWSNQRIGAELVIGVSTVKSHVHAVLRKLGVTRRMDAAELLRSSRLHLLGGEKLPEVESRQAEVESLFHPVDGCQTPH